MDGVDFEFEELDVAEAVGLAFHGFDFVVGALEGGGGDGVIVPVEDAVAVDLDRPGHFLHAADARVFGQQDPEIEGCSGTAFVRLAPDLPELFRQIVRRR